jgi:Ni2+-binding GTPase involved in maturation of urease and hydrogenase
MELKATISKKLDILVVESGGGLSNTGKAFLIAGPNGDKKTAMYIRTAVQLACEEHALIPVVIGDIVIKTSPTRLDFESEYGKFCLIENETIQLTKLHTFR